MGKEGAQGSSWMQGADLPIRDDAVDVAVVGEGEVPELSLLPVVIGGVVAKPAVEHFLAAVNMSLPHQVGVIR